VRSLRSGFSLVLLWLGLQWSPAAANSNTCIPLETVDIDDKAVFGTGELQALIKPRLGDCIDADLMRDLLTLISNRYIEQGYVTTRPYLLEQDISDGQIEIRVVIGKIESIIDADSGLANSRIATAFAFRDEVLNLRQLETSLEVIERPDSVSASFEILPGNTPGTSIVAIKTLDANPLQLEWGINAQTDLDEQLSFRSSLDNPFNINDILEFRYNSGEVRESFQSNRSRELVYSLPLGSYLFELSRSDISFKQRLQGINQSFLSSGETISDKFSISKLLNRSQTGRTRLVFAIEFKDSRNFFEDQIIDVSSYETSQAQLGLQQDWLRPWGQLSTAWVFHKGLDLYGARDDDYYTPENGFDNPARLQFEKLTVDSNLSYRLENPDWQLAFQLFLQYSDDLLFANDQLSLGSPYTVRGYSSALAGGNAWYLRADLIRQFSSFTNPLSGKSLAKTIGVSFGLDYGDVKCEIDNPDLCGEIYGAGISFDVSDSNFSGRLIWGHPLKEIGDEIGDKDQFLLDLRWMF